MNNFGEWLRAKRIDLGLKQADVARRAGVSVSYVSTLERSQPHSTTGARLTPERSKLTALAKAVQGDIDEALHLCGYASTVLFIWITGRESGDVSAWLTGMFIGFIAAVGYGIWAWKRTEGRKSNIEAAYKAAMKKWEHSWICLRCGNTYRVR